MSILSLATILTKKHHVNVGNIMEMETGIPASTPVHDVAKTFE